MSDEHVFTDEEIRRRLKAGDPTLEADLRASAIRKFLEQQHRGIENAHRILILELDHEVELLSHHVPCRYCGRMNEVAEQCLACGAPPAPWPAEKPPPMIILRRP